MKDESPYIVLTHHHDGRVLAVVVDGTHATPQEVKDGIAALAERSTLLTERDGARALCAEYGAALRMCERRNTKLRAVVTAARAVHTAYHGDPAVVSLAAAWAALEAALEEAGDA